MTKHIFCKNEPRLILNFNRGLWSNIFHENAVFYEFLELGLSSLGNWLLKREKYTTEQLKNGVRGLNFFPEMHTGLFFEIINFYFLVFFICRSLCLGRQILYKLYACYIRSITEYCSPVYQSILTGAPWAAEDARNLCTRPTWSSTSRGR